MLRIGVVGLGRMGSNIARRLKAESRIAKVTVVYDRHAPLAKSVATEIGAQAASTLADVTAQADYIITVVTDDAAMRTIFAASGDSLFADAKGRIFINCATVSPRVHVEIEAAANQAGARSVEACMAGSITQAQAGTLVLLLAGDAATVDEIRPVLESMGSVDYVGATGKAAQVKALVNMLMNINTAALAEALGLGQALGLDLTALSDIFRRTGAASRVLETDGADMIARDHEVYFSAAHAAKDSGIALKLAHDLGLDLPLADLTKQRYEELVALGFGESDKSAIAELSFPGRALAQATNA